MNHEFYSKELKEEFEILQQNSLLDLKEIDNISKDILYLEKFLRENSIFRNVSMFCFNSEIEGLLMSIFLEWKKGIKGQRLYYSEKYEQSDKDELCNSIPLIETKALIRKKLYPFLSSFIKTINDNQIPLYK